MITDNELALRIDQACARDPHIVLRKGPSERNIGYIEGMDLDGTANANRKNAFDDLRVVWTYINGTPTILGKWEATTQPGTYYTVQHLLNPKGAAIIDLGYQAVWQTGMHRGKYDALIQTGGAIRVWRDGKKSYARDGNVLDTGWFGIDEHHGYDADRSDIGPNSAGCLVARLIAGHKDFMRFIRQDPGYAADDRFIFGTTVLQASQVLSGVVTDRQIVKPQVPKGKVGAATAVTAAIASAGTYLHQHWLIIVLAVVFVGLCVAAYEMTKKE